MDTPTTTRAQRVVTRAAVSLVALVGAVVSYAHMYEVALAAGESWRAWLLPLSVDGMIVAASLGAWQAKRRGESVPEMTAVSLLLGLAVSVAANVATPFLPWLAQHHHGALSATVAAWPAIALGLAFEELLRSARVSTEASDTAETAVDTAPDTTATPASDTDTAPARQAVPQRQRRATRPRRRVSAAPVGAVPAQRRLSPRPSLVDTAPAPVSAGRATVDTAPGAASGDDPREAARELIRSGAQLTGQQLGEQFGRGESWGRSQIRAVKAEAQRPALVAVEA